MTNNGIGSYERSGGARIVVPPSRQTLDRLDVRGDRNSVRSVSVAPNLVSGNNSGSATVSAAPAVRATPNVPDFSTSSHRAVASASPISTGRQPMMARGHLVITPVETPSMVEPNIQNPVHLDTAMHSTQHVSQPATQPVTTAPATGDFMPTVPVYSSSVAVKRHHSNRPGHVATSQPVRYHQAVQQPMNQAMMGQAMPVQANANLSQQMGLMQKDADGVTIDLGAGFKKLFGSVKKAQAKHQANKQRRVVEQQIANNQQQMMVQQANFAPIANNANAMARSPQLARQSASAVAMNHGSNIERVMASNVSPAGTASMTMATPGNILARTATNGGGNVTFAFKFNRERAFAVLRYLAIALIIGASGYLAWDTYTTNQSVKNSFNGTASASAMSISGTNPATADQSAISQEDKIAYTVPADQPRYITIPSIGVNARVLSVGVNSKGNIDTPSNLNDTAWYDGSAKPGQEGQVFIDGHTSFSNSIAAAFNALPKLQAGEQITIEKGDGERINYKVTDVKTLDVSQVNMAEALSTQGDSKKGLTLMTCTGTFNYRTQTADKRLIVYATQE